MSENDNCPLCNVVGIEVLEPCNGPKIAKRWEEMPRKPIVYGFGQDVHLEEGPQAAAFTLLQRDYPAIAAFNNEENGSKVGAIIAPEEFVPKDPTVIDPEIAEEIEAEKIKEKKIIGSLRQIKGNQIEERCYDALKEYYKEYNDPVLMIHELDCEEMEMDFCIINFKLQMILMIEVKKWLGHIKGDKDLKKSPALKARNQLEANKAWIKKWFCNDLQGTWSLVSSIFCVNFDDSLFCSNCKKFNAREKKKEWPSKVRNFEEGIAIKGQKKYPSDFVTLCQYLLFCLPKVDIPVRGRFIEAVKKAIKKASDFENIKYYWFPKSCQRTFMAMPKLVFVSPWGSGKTTFKTLKAIDIVKKTGEKVLYLIFADASDDLYAEERPSLLMLDLQDFFKDFENFITVKMAPFINCVSLASFFQQIEDFKHVMVDELFGDFDHLSEMSQNEIRSFVTSRETAWISMPNWYQPKDYSSLRGDVVKIAQSSFPGFEVSKMNTPFRMPRKVSEVIQSNYENEFSTSSGSKADFNAELMRTAKLPPTLTKGFYKLIEDPSGNLPLHILLEKAFREVPHGRFAIIIISTKGAYKIANELERLLLDMDGLHQSKKECSCFAKVAVPLLVDMAFEVISRPRPLYHCNSYADETDLVQDWIKGNKDRDLDVTQDLARGFENDIVVNIGLYTEMFSRATAQLIAIDNNMLLDGISNLFQLRSKEHELHDCCQVSFMQMKQRPTPSPTHDFILDKLMDLKNCKKSSTPQQWRKDRKNPLLFVLLDQLLKRNRNEWKNVDVFAKALKRHLYENEEWTREFLQSQQRDIDLTEWGTALENDSMLGLVYLDNDMIIELAKKVTNMEIVILTLMDDPLPEDFDQDVITLFHFHSRVYHFSFYLSVFPKREDWK